MSGRPVVDLVLDQLETIVLNGSRLLCHGLGALSPKVTSSFAALERFAVGVQDLVLLLDKLLRLSRVRFDKGVEGQWVPGRLVSIETIPEVVILELYRVVVVWCYHFLHRTNEIGGVVHFCQHIAFRAGVALRDIVRDAPVSGLDHVV